MVSVDLLLQEAIRTAAQNRHDEAAAMFRRVVELQPRNEPAWVWLSELAGSHEERIVCLEKVLAINPENRAAQERLGALKEVPTEVKPGASDAESLGAEEGAVESVQPASEQSVGFCRMCGTDNPGDSRFCRGCGAPLLERQEIQEEVTVARTIGEAPPTVDEEKPKQPWYFSSTFLRLTFLFFTPLWAVLILADRRHGRTLKAFAGLLTAAYILLWAYVLGGAQFASTVIGPATIEFGSSYVETGNGVVIENPRSAFYFTEEMAWVVHLRGPAKTTSLDLVISRVAASGGEQVVDSGPMRLAVPDFQVLYGRYPLLSLTPGHHRLRVMSGDNTLAEGDFEVTY